MRAAKFAALALAALIGASMPGCLVTRSANTAAPAANGRRPLQPPKAARDPLVRELHGDRLVDDYAWMRKRGSDEVMNYLQAENDYTRAMMQSTGKVQTRLLQEFHARAQEQAALPAVRRAEYEYYTRLNPEQPYPRYCRKRVAAGAREEELLDLNGLAKGDDAYLDLGSFEVSDDGNFLAYSLDLQGSRNYTLFVKDLRSGQLGPERIEHVASVSWAAERTLFYTVEDEDGRAHRIYRHVLGEAKDTLVREEADPRFALQVWRSRSRAFVFMGALANNTTEVAFVPARQPDQMPQIIARRRERHEYYVDHRGDWFFIRTNDRSPNFRLVAAKVATPAETGWRELRPADSRVMLEELAVFRDYLVLHEREAGLPHIRIAELRAMPAAKTSTPEAPLIEGAYRVEMPEPVYELHAEENPSYDTPAYRFSYESLTSPTTYYEYRVRTRKLDLIARATTVSGYDPSLYKQERISARAADGTQIPISLVYRADKPAGPRPMVLEAFGAYGYPFPTTFSSPRVSLLDRGFVHAIAHVRGGGELGPRWHDQGRLLNKRNSFSDFITVAEHLIGNGYTAPDRLAIQGASAGGLLVATVINERPELFKAAVLDVPLVDVLNTMADANSPLAESEYEEWGNPAAAAVYRYIKSYCPYNNIKRKDYPTLLVKAAYDDSEVMYWQPAKYVAKLRATAGSRRPVLLWTKLDSEAADPLAERAFDYAFLLSQVGKAEAVSETRPAAQAQAPSAPQSPTILSNQNTNRSR